MGGLMEVSKNKNETPHNLGLGMWYTTERYILPRIRLFLENLFGGESANPPPLPLTSRRHLADIANDQIAPRKLSQSVLDVLHRDLVMLLGRDPEYLILGHLVSLF